MVNVADIEARNNSYIYAQKLEMIHLFLLNFDIVLGFTVVRIFLPLYNQLLLSSTSFVYNQLFDDAQMAVSL